ncbi:MAG: hypothetical protein KDE55_01030 [Novosphingobium sp.]|nr:hypothetical protein [Novosphingobium sp.]
MLDHAGTGGGYDLPYTRIRELQLVALNERFQQQGKRIKLVKLRAEEAGITEISELADAVPLLLPHTAYKSYPESFLIEERWDRLTKWLGTVSAHPIADVDLDGIDGIDDWISRLERAGHYVSCSSGTSGKAAMLIGSKRDMDWAANDSVAACAWGAGIVPENDRLIFGLSPVASVPRNHVTQQAMRDAFGKPGTDFFQYPVPPMTIGSITRMIVLRKRIADGSAKPSELAEFEETSASRQKAMDEAIGISARALVEARSEKLYISGYWAGMYTIARAVREMGYDAKDFDPQNTCFIGGGLKGAQLPPDYKEYVFGTFNIAPERNYQMYGMQELGSSMPRCHEGGRYHLPPWLIALPLNKDGDALVEIGSGPVTGRAAFFDLSLDGRWGGVISGDRIEIDFGPCACGNASPSIADTIARYADLQGDDKIACSGTVDAYVRGMS